MWPVLGYNDLDMAGREKARVVRLRLKRLEAGLLQATSPDIPAFLVQAGSVGEIKEVIETLARQIHAGRPNDPPMRLRFEFSFAS